MRAVTGTLGTFLASGAHVFWVADLLTLTTTDGTVWRWTPGDVAISYGGHTYSPGIYRSRSSLRSATRELPSLDLILSGVQTLPSGRTVYAAALARYWHGAQVTLDHLVGAYPGDLSVGTIPGMFVGEVSDVRASRASVQLTCRTWLELASETTLPRFKLQPACPYVVYDAATCGVSKASFTTAATVAASPAPTRALLYASFSVAPAGGLYDGGVGTFTSGALNGVSFPIRQHGGGNPASISPAVPLPAAPAAGDGLSLVPTCDQTYATCGSRFANQARFRGAPLLPSGGVT